MCSEVPFLLRGIAVCPDAYIFCESSKRMDENEKTLVGILIFDMIMGMLCLWAGGKRQDTTAPASQEVSTGKITGEEDVAKKIALTFDDGPHPRYTEQLLDGLKERNVVATFL